MQNLLGGLIQEQLLMLQIHYRDSIRGTRRTLQRGERRIKVANGVEAQVEAIGDLSLDLDDDFVVKLSDVLYVPSL
jgi:hypothetical protein